MATSINTNLASLFAQNSLSNAQNNLASSVQRLSSGLRINSAKDDAAGLSIAQNMQSQINGTNQSIRNLSDATNLLQVADSSLSTVQDMLLRLKQLSVQGFDGSLSASQKLNIVQEMKDLNSEINATAQRTQFNGINLLTSGSSLDTVNSDLKNGASLANATVKVSTTSGLGAGTTLNDAGNTIYSISLDNGMAQNTPGSYTLMSSGNNLTLTGTFNGRAQSQTVSLANLVGNDPALSGVPKVINTNVNFNNFGISLSLTSSIIAGDTVTGSQLAAAITAKSTSIVVDGKGGQVSNVRLSGVNPGTYQMTFDNTGSVSTFGVPAGLVSGQTSAGMARNVALVGGNGSGATANISYDAQGKISNIAVQAAGTGYKAGDVLSTAAIAAGTANAATIATADGGAAGTEQARVTFKALNAGEETTLAGLTFTAGTGGATANQVAAAFSNLNNGDITGAGTLGQNGNGTYSGVLNGWNTQAAVGAAVTFSSTQANTVIDDLAVAAAGVRPVVLITQGGANVTEQAKVTFKGLDAGQSITLAGLTFTAGTSALSAAEVTRAFMGLSTTNTAAQANATNVERVNAGGGALAGITGSFTAGTLTGWNTAGSLISTTSSANDTILLTSSTPSSNVVDLTRAVDPNNASLTISAVDGLPVVTTTQGGVGGVTTSSVATFANGLAAGQAMNLGGLIYTADKGVAVTAAELTAAYANLSNGAITGSGTGKGSYSGQLSGFNSSAVSGATNTTLSFTSSTPNTNATAITAAVAGVNPTITKVRDGSPLVNEVSNVNFTASALRNLGDTGVGTLLSAGRTLSLAGLTFTAGVNGATKEQLAAAFAGLTNGTTAASLNAANRSSAGTFSGTLTGWNTSAVASDAVTVEFTSSTNLTNVEDLAATAYATAPGLVATQGATSSNEIASATFKALAAGQSLTMGGLTLNAVGNMTAIEVAAKFANLADGAKPVANGGTLADVSTATTESHTVTFTNGLAAANESVVATFSNLSAGNSFTLNGLTLTASGNMTAAQVAAAMVSGNQTSGNLRKADGTAGVLGTDNGVAGSYILKYSNVPTSTVVTAGQAQTHEIDVVQFKALLATETAIFAGMTFTAGALGASAEQVATAFANLSSGMTTATANTNALGRGVAAANGTFTGAGPVTTDWSSGLATGALVTFSHATNFDAGNVALIPSGSSAGTTPVVTRSVSGLNAATAEVKTYTFSALTTGQTLVHDGLTFTSGTAGTTADQLALAFGSIGSSAGGTISAANANTAAGANVSAVIGTFTGGTSLVGTTKSTAVAGKVTYSQATAGVPAAPLVDAITLGGTVPATQYTGVASSNTVTFTSPNANTNDAVDFAAATGAGSGLVSLGTVSQGRAATTLALSAGQNVTVAGLTFTAGTAGATAIQVALAFNGLTAGASAATAAAAALAGGVTAQMGTFTSGALSLDFNASSLNGVITLTGTATGNLVDPAAVTTVNPTITSTTQGATAATEAVTATFTAMAAGQTLTLNGLTFTSKGASTAAEVAGAFASRTAGVNLGTSATNATSTATGTIFGVAGAFTSAAVSNTNQVVFAVPTADTPTTDLVASGTSLTAAGGLGGVALGTPTQGLAAATEATVVTFNALTAGQQTSIGGLIFTAGSAGATAAQLATAFSGLATTNTSTTANLGLVAKGITSAMGSFTAGTLTGWGTSANPTGSTLTFTSSAAGNVTDLVPASAGTNPAFAKLVDGSAATKWSGQLTGFSTGSVTGAANNTVAFTATTAGNVDDLTSALPLNPTVTTLVQGNAQSTESAVVNFTSMSSGQTLTLAGQTFTVGAAGTGAVDAFGNVTAAQVAQAFAGTLATAGTLVGTLTGYTKAANAVGSQLTYTSTTLNQNVKDLASPLEGLSPDVVTIVQGGTTNSNETAQVTFDAAEMTSVDSVTVGGLTFTAGANGATRAQVAAAFSNLPAGTSSANLSSANGTFTGTLTGWSTGSSNGTGVSFTSTTAFANVDNLTSSVSRRQALNALSGIAVGGLTNQTGDNVLMMTGLVNGNLQTQGINLRDNAANSSQTLNFDVFGIQFDVDSFQAQTAGDIGATLASLNSSSPNYGTSGAFKPGQVVVGQGANSALKFQSGADSSAFIQIDTLNIQTGSSGIEAGSDKQMMDIGSVVSGSGVGKLGALGLNDSIDTWQTAFKNAAATMDAAVEYISSKRATYGSQMNRLSYITTNLTAQSTNLQNSRSAIIDTDFASETAKLTKGQIMQQAATAMLAQANQMPNVILSLLK
jgi:flagellin